MPKCTSATIRSEPQGYGNVIVVKGSSYVETTPRGFGYIICSLGIAPVIYWRPENMIKVANTDTTHNLSPDTLTKVPLMGSNPITAGLGGTNFTVNAGSDDVTCNFNGNVGVIVSIYSLTSPSGLQFKMKMFVDEVEQAEVSLSHLGFDNGSYADFPLMPIAVTTGEKISVRSIKNSFSGTMTIGAAGSCYMTLVKI